MERQALVVDRVLTSSTMRRLEDVRGGEWVWTRPRWWVRRWELREGNELAVVMTATGLWRPRLAAETASGRWSLQLGGIGRTRIEVVPEGASAPAAVYTSNWLGGGTLVAGRTTLRWCRSGWWSKPWRFEDENGQELLSFEVHGPVFGNALRMRASEAGRAHPELTSMALIGCCALWVIGRRSASAL